VAVIIVALGKAAIYNIFSACNETRRMQQETIRGVYGMNQEEKKVFDAMKKAGKPVRPRDLVEALELDTKEISKIIDGLKKKGMVVSPKRCFYAPSDS